MEYRSVADLNADVVAWSETLPRDIDVVVGIPRSGMLVATLLALHMDRALSDLDSYVEGRAYLGGARTRERGDQDGLHALIVDDSVLTGRAVEEARRKVDAARLPGRTSWGALYVDRRTRSHVVDFAHSVLPAPRVFEWNVLHHSRLPDCCMDIDGVLCPDPTTDENDDGPAYEQFLCSAPARVVPGQEVGWLVTSRLERYRPQTEAWLAAQGIRYRELVMHPAGTGAERRAAGDHATRKAQTYVRTGAWLFIESDSGQAEQIARLAGKPVFCTDTRELVRPGASSALRRQVADIPRRLPAVVARARRVSRRVLRVQR